MDIVFKKAANTTTLTAVEVVSTIKKIRRLKNPDKIAELKNQIVMTNVKLVSKILQPYRKVASLSVEDMFTEGVMGIYDAIDKYDVTQNAKFSTYAYWWIRQKINQYVRDNRFNHVDQKSVSIDNPLGVGENSRTVADTIPVAETTCRELGAVEGTGFIQKILATLPEREQVILAVRFGL